MALRIDFYSVTPGVDLERLPVAELESGAHPDATWLGCTSASDDDELALTELLDRIARHGVLDGAGVQGVGPDTAELTEADAQMVLGVASDARDHLWASVVSASIARAATTGRRLGWWTRFDTGGSTHDDAMEWPTAASLASG